jgi:hypothetical protein
MNSLPIRRTTVTVLQDVSALLLGVVRDSTSTGCRGLGELLGYGRVSEKVYDADSLRWQCIQCLKSSESGAIYTSLRKAPSDEHSLDAIDVNVDNDSPAFQSDSKLSVDLSVDGDSPAFQSDSKSSADLSVDGDGDSNEEDLIPEEGSTFDCEGIVDQMSGINMDDDDEVEKYITAAIGPEERKILTFTSDDETDILSLLPCDAQLCES